MIDLATIELRAQALLADSPADAAHDLAHIRRVVANARRLATQEHAQLDVVVPAAWLHDCVPIAKNSPLRSQASRLAAARALELLEESGYPIDLLPAIRHAIEAHSFSANIPPATIEARVLQDADRLDALGAVGLARCLMLGGEMGRALYADDDPFCERRAPNDLTATIDHFYTKLLGLADTMQTVSARVEARIRTDYLQAFLDRLRSEISIPPETP